uniref:Uncharacterized protein n=1 Tax=Vespula pensylvanica TaxID=30213 RepID=A0A834UFL0_VESPE|nr:hypothetical protein H0235_003812 [Vespula pensylvanica]
MREILDAAPPLLDDDDDDDNDDDNDDCVRKKAILIYQHGSASCYGPVQSDTNNGLVRLNLGQGEAGSAARSNAIARVLSLTITVQGELMHGMIMVIISGGRGSYDNNNDDDDDDDDDDHEDEDDEFSDHSNEKAV